MSVTYVHVHVGVVYIWLCLFVDTLTHILLPYFPSFSSPSLPPSLLPFFPPSLSLSLQPLLITTLLLTTPPLHVPMPLHLENPT